MNIEVRFHAAGSNQNNIIVSVENGLGSGTVNTLAITKPGGGTIISTPSIIGATALFSASIPEDSDGIYLYGTYSFSITANDPATSGVEFSQTKTFDFQNRAGSLSIDAYADPFIRKLVVIDNTDYPTGTTSKSFVVISPRITGETNVADVTLTGTGSVSMIRSSGVVYNNVTYRVRPSAILETSTIDGIWDFGGVYGYTSDDIEVNVVYDDCGLLDCVHSKLIEIDNQACISGGFSALPAGTKELYDQLQLYLGMWNNSNACRDAQKASYYREKIEGLVGTCNCTTSKTIPETNTVYLKGDSAYDTWLNDGNTGSEEDFLNTLNPVGNWTFVPATDFDPDFETDEDDPLRYRVTRDGLQFAGKFVRIPSTDPVSPFAVLLPTFNPGNVVPEAPIPVYSDSFRTVGSFCKQSNAWVMYADVTLAGNPSRIISGKIPWEGVLSTLTYSFERTFTPFTNAQISGNPNISLSWSKDERFCWIKGMWTANTTPGSGGGLEIITESTFISLGLNLEAGIKAPIFATAGAHEFELLGWAEIQGGLTLYNQDPTTYVSWASYNPSFSMQIPLA